MVRIIGVAPREIAPKFGIPAQEGVAELRLFLFGDFAAVRHAAAFAVSLKGCANLSGAGKLAGSVISAA